MKAKLLSLLIILGLILGYTVNAASARSNPAAANWSRSGWFSARWGDGMDGATAQAYVLTDAGGQVTALTLDPQLLARAGGVLALDRRYVTVEGFTPQTLDPQTGQASVTVTSIALVPAPNIPVINGGGGGGGGTPPPLPVGTTSWISVMCKFPEDAVEPQNLAFLQAMYANAKPGLDHYWRELSYDKINLLGSTAAGWFTMPHPLSYYNPSGTAGGANQTALANDCTAAADPFVDFSLYQSGGINMMFNLEFDYGWAWGGSMSLNLDGVNQQWRTTWLPPWAYSTISVVEHEMGHGYGLPHSSGMYGETYDNPWDVMSNDRYNLKLFYDPVYGPVGQHTISYHKDMLGWIDPVKKFVAGAGTNATITLERLAQPTNANPLMVQIPIGGSVTHFYTVEARQLVGYDEKLPGNAVIIHEVNPDLYIGAHLFDMDGNGDNTDAGAMWTPGETFSDAANDIYITVVSATPTGFVLNILSGVGNLNSLQLNLPANITVQQNVPTGAVVSYTATATDSVDGSVPVTCDPPSGSTFWFGTTTVYCSASNSGGDTAYGLFTVTVVDAPSGNLLLNPGFDQTDSYPRAWTYSVPRTSLISLLECGFFVSPGCSLKLPATQKTSIVTQTVPYAGQAGQNFSFGLFSAAKNVPPGGSYKVEVSLFDRFNRVMMTQTLVFNDGTHGFEMVNGLFTAPADFTKIRYRFYFQKSSGIAWFDEAFIYQMP